MKARSAHLVALDEGGREAELPGPDCGGVSACPAADDYEIELVHTLPFAFTPAAVVCAATEMHITYFDYQAQSCKLSTGTRLAALSPGCHFLPVPLILRYRSNERINTRSSCSSSALYNLLVNFHFTAAEEDLRREACDWLTRELGTTHDSNPAPMPPGYMPARDFELKLGAKGWLALTWPKEYGGGGRPVSEQFIVEEEVALHGGPASDAIARVIVAPILQAAGSEEQKRRYLPRLARGQITFCLGYTEPESGSDLASLQTRAVREGDDYVINGRKVFTSGADSSEYCWLAARTSDENPKHAGISVFIVPMDSPGVEVRPLVNLLNERWFNEVIFEDVRVPVAERVGRENEGWQVLTSALGVERITIYRAFVHHRALAALIRYARSAQNGRRRWEEAPVRQRLAQLTTDFEIARLLLWRTIRMHEAGVEYRAQAAMVKLFNTEFAQRLYQTGIDVLGLSAQLVDGSPLATWQGAIPHAYLSAVQDTIGAGTSEVQREIIALRGLGLPRG
ncbi:MAG: acyl-CoA dehydrogenase [Chloroflexi bacterium]|nr:MAG: acyl-CoA dehydrogenase [Chloroflexota bacterium]